MMTIPDLKMSFTKETFKDFTQVYKEALSNESEYFTFEGHEFYIGYAKYLIEFLEPYYK